MYACMFMIGSIKAFFWGCYCTLLDPPLYRAAPGAGADISFHSHRRAAEERDARYRGQQ